MMRHQASRDDAPGLKEAGGASLAAGTAAVEVAHLRKSYGSVVAVHDVSFCCCPLPRSARSACAWRRWPRPRVPSAASRPRCSTRWCSGSWPSVCQIRPRCGKDTPLGHDTGLSGIAGQHRTGNQSAQPLGATGRPPAQTGIAADLHE